MSIPLVLFDDAPRARRSDRLTSHAAADSSDTAGSRIAVLAILGATSKPLCDEEIHRVHQTLTLTPYTPARLRTARHELEELGVVTEAGETRTVSGRRATTWTLKERS